MLRKIIATAMSVALLANSGMISSANDSYAENSATTETEVYSVSVATETEDASPLVETTVVLTVATDETTTTTAETTSPEDVGAAIRKGLNVQTRDIVFFDDSVELKDSKGRIKMTDPEEHIWLVDIDDVNQRFRVYVPRLNTVLSTTIYYLDYSCCVDAKVESEEGLVIGDVDFNGRVNAKDLTLMKRGALYGWNDPTSYLMSDMSADGVVTIKDLVLMQKWLLCEE